MDDLNSNTKTIFITESSKTPRTTSKSISTSKSPISEKSKRVITKTKLWNFNPNELSYEYQKEIVSKVTSHINNPSIEPHSISHIIKFIIGEIQKKIYGYKCQDLKKELFSQHEFINMENIINKLIKCNLQCYYCNESVYILYEYVREPRQWTLERINNAEGHNTTNTEIACLSCNLRRRCIFHERYLFTKQLSNIIKKEEVKENIEGSESP